MSESLKRRWYAFRLRTLLVVVVVLGCVLTPLAYEVKQARDQRRAVKWVLRHGGSVTYDWQATESTSPPGPEWLRAMIGDDCFQSVDSISIWGGGSTTSASFPMPADLLPLAPLASVQRLELFNTYVSDLSPLRNWTNLRQLSIARSRVSDLSPLAGCTHLVSIDARDANVALQEAQRMHAKLPNCKITLFDYVPPSTLTDGELDSLQKAFPHSKIMRW